MLAGAERERLKLWQVPYCQTSPFDCWDLGSPCLCLGAQGNLHQVSFLPPSSVNWQDRESWRMKAALETRHPPMVCPIQALCLGSSSSPTELMLQIHTPAANFGRGRQCFRLLSATLILLTFALLITKGSNICSNTSRIRAYVRGEDLNSRSQTTKVKKVYKIMHAKRKIINLKCPQK